jgi:hypothetical protein
LSSSNPETSGGCQCGAVRYHAVLDPQSAHVCYCRMCQKAAGGPFAALVHADNATLVWTRGTPGEFMSSELAARGFCAACGTPLYYRSPDAPYINLTIGSLDDPTLALPLRQMGLEGRWPGVDHLATLPDTGATEEDMADEAPRIAASNRQHPDHDTAAWPLEREG